VTNPALVGECDVGEVSEWDAPVMARVDTKFVASPAWPRDAGAGPRRRHLPTATVSVVLEILGIAAMMTGLFWIGASFTLCKAPEQVVSGRVDAAF
jgi:hypothetical protein